MKLVEYLKEMSPDQEITVMDEEGVVLFCGYNGECDDGRFSDEWEVVDHLYCAGCIGITVK